MFVTIAHNDDNLYRAEDNQPEFGPAKEPRYLLYDVNPGEGFNLRRDVYMRVANLVHFLNEESSWILVLPPWGRLYHWQSRELGPQVKIPWKKFFDLTSLGLHAPVIEFEDYLKMNGKPEVEEVYYLQRYAEGWTKWEEKFDVRECIEPQRYHKDDNGLWRGQFFGYENMYAKKFVCLSTQAAAITFKPFLLNNTTAKSVFLDRAETLIHGQYSEWSREWWTARRSMLFSKQLRDLGDQFRKDFLDSNDKDDKTELEVWNKMRRNHGDAKGGPYMAVHLRRKDYLYAHKREVPTLDFAAHQILQYLKKYKLKKLFVATDAPKEEFDEFKEEFKNLKYSVDIYRYQPSKELFRELKDGGMAIIDQWICAHARVFVGTYVSTFSFRIQEEREILGFKQETTYNRLCGDEEPTLCEQPTKWDIKY